MEFTSFSQVLDHIKILLILVVLGTRDSLQGQICKQEP